MSYELTKSDGSTLTELSDGLIDSGSASIKFIGRNVVNYGEVQNENFLHLLENFANTIAPSIPLAGQLWFDSSASVLRVKMYDGSIWRQVPTITYNNSASNLISGDLWFDTNTQQLYIKTGTTYTLIGPNSNSTTTGRFSTPVKINGVNFDGSADITISAATPYTLTAGTYLSGSSFTGAANTTWTVDVGTVNAATPFKVVARDSAGDIWYTVGRGTSTSSRYADLAEKYLADQDYEAGTVVTIGGSAEVTACQPGDRAIGVVSANPGYMMNSELVDGTYIALKGRVPVKIHGDIKKGDKLVSSSNGHGIFIPGHPDVFAIALEDSNGKTIIEALIL